MEIKCLPIDLIEQPAEVDKIGKEDERQGFLWETFTLDPSDQ